MQSNFSQGQMDRGLIYQHDYSGEIRLSKQVKEEEEEEEWYQHLASDRA